MHDLPYPRRPPSHPARRARRALSPSHLVLAVLVALLALVLLPAAPAEAAAPAAEPGRAAGLLDAPDTVRGDDFWVLRSGPPPGTPTGGEPATVALARFTVDGEFQEERVWTLPGMEPPVSKMVDRRGRLWVTVYKPIEPREDGSIVLGTPRGMRLLVYARDGELLAAAEVPGRLLNLAADGGPAAHVLVHDEAGARVVRFDPFSGKSTEQSTFRPAELGPTDGGCVRADRSLVLHEDGSAWLRRGFSDGEGGYEVVRRYTASGAPAGAWRVPRAETDRRHGWTRTAVAGESLLLSMGDRVFRLDPDSATPEVWRLEDGVDQLLGLEDHVLALHDDGRSLAVLRDGGSHAVILDLPPAGVSFAEWRRRRMELRGVSTGGASLAELVDRLVLERGRAAEEARRELRRGDPAATAAALLAGFERWGRNHHLLVEAAELLRRDPAAAGPVFVARLDEPPPPSDGLAALLVRSWEEPSQAFVLDLAERVLQADRDSSSGNPWDSLSEQAWAAFSSGDAWYPGGWEGVPAAFTPKPDRFPAPSFLVDHFLTALAPDDQATDPATRRRGLVDLSTAHLFFLPQFARAAPALEARLRDPGHPDHANSLRLVLSFARELAGVPNGDFGASEAELRRRATAWRDGDDAPPRLRWVGAVLTTALGDSAGLEPMLRQGGREVEELRADQPGAEADAVRGLFRRIGDEARPTLAARLVSGLPAQRPRLAERLIADLAPHLDGEGLAGLVSRLADPGLDCELRPRLELTLLMEDVWPRVPVEALADLVAAGDPEAEAGAATPGTESAACGSVSGQACVAGFHWLGAVYGRLEDHPEARRSLEGRVAPMLPQWVVAGEPPPAGTRTVGSWVALFSTPGAGLGRRLVPTATLTHLTAHTPDGPMGDMWIAQLARIADARGPWPGWLDLLQERLALRPGLLQRLPAGAADRWLGPATVDRLVLTSPEPAGAGGY